ncbi:unnamed protein product, partial [Rotaria sordida]
MGIFQFTI